MRRLNLAAIVLAAALAASCTPPMTTYDYPEHGFTVDFPAAPKVEDKADPRTGAHLIVFDSKSFGRDFAVTVTAVDPKRDIDAVVDDASAAIAKTAGGAVTYRTTCATAEGALGREMVISTDGRRAVRARFYRSGARFYILTAKSHLGLSPAIEPTDPDPSIESGSDNDSAVTHFLISFHLEGAAGH